MQGWGAGREGEASSPAFLSRLTQKPPLTVIDGLFCAVRDTHRVSREGETCGATQNRVKRGTCTAREGTREAQRLTLLEGKVGGGGWVVETKGAQVGVRDGRACHMGWGEDPAPSPTLYRPRAPPNL